MGLFDSIAKLFIDPVDTSGAESAAKQGTERARGLLQPGISANETAIARVMALLQDPGSFQGTPAFDFALDQGVAARDKSAAARGTLGSGGFQKELTAFGQGLANQERGNEIARFLAFINQTGPNVRQGAANELGLGKDLAGISLGAENARVGTSSSLLKGSLGLAGAAFGAF
ncbi:MAG: hypothetical protein GY952_06780 [Rhodobacteraceae bacterium]|nr:hypothetical protein [Paracoccaceae bacterium]